MKEPTTNDKDIDYGTFTVKPDQDHQDLVDLAGSIYHKYNDDNDSGDMNYDYGLEYDWTKRTVQVSIT